MYTAQSTAKLILFNSNFDFYHDCELFSVDQGGQFFVKVPHRTPVHKLTMPGMREGRNMIKS